MFVHAGQHARVKLESRYRVKIDGVGQEDLLRIIAQVEHNLLRHLSRKNNNINKDNGQIESKAFQTYAMKLNNMASSIEVKTSCNILANSQRKENPNDTS